MKQQKNNFKGCISIFVSFILVMSFVVMPTKQAYGAQLPIVTSVSNSNYNSVVITGTATAGKTLKFTINNSYTTSIVDSYGIWYLIVPINSLVLGMTDGAGIDIQNYILLDLRIGISTNMTQFTRINMPENKAVINVPKPVISGITQAKTAVTLIIDGAVITDAATSDIIGNWSYTLPVSLIEGTHTISAMGKNGAGTSAITEITVDTKAPAPPVIKSPLNNFVTNNLRPVISGTCEKNSIVNVSIDGKEFLDAAIADGAGNWSYGVLTDLTAGNHNINAVAKDAANNISIASEKSVFTIDITPPSQPIIAIPPNGTMTNSVRPVISGTCEKNSIVNVLIDGKEFLDAATVDGAGNWSYIPTVNLNEGAHNIGARARDTVNNMGAVSLISWITVDTTSPNQPVLNKPAYGSKTNNVKPIISGTAEANSKITVIIDDSEIPDVTVADIIGNWSYTPAVNLYEGKHIIAAKAKDTARNISKIALRTLLIVDTTPPLAPLIKSPLKSRVTNNQTPLISGSAEANSNIILTIDGTEFGNLTIADAAGNWKYTPTSELTEGTHTIGVKARDLANNVSTISETVVIIDATEPLPPVIKIPKNNLVTKDKRPIISGKSEASLKVTIRIIGGKRPYVYTVKANLAGQWSFKLPKNLGLGKYKIEAQVKDLANNISQTSNTISITVK